MITESRKPDTEYDGYDGYLVVCLAYCHDDGMTHPTHTGWAEGADMQRTEELWDEFALDSMWCFLKKMGGFGTPEEVKKAFDLLFPDFEEAYSANNPYSRNDYNYRQWDHIVTWQGTEKQHHLQFNRWAQDLIDGHFGGDDTVFDYWPSGFGALVAYAYDLDAATGQAEYYLNRCRVVWDKRAHDFDENTNDAMTEEVCARP